MTTFEAVPQGTFYAVRRNVARGITPTVSDWDVSPDHLERVTDGRVDIATGIGVTTTGGSAQVGKLSISFSEPKLVAVSLIHRSWADSGGSFGVYLYPKISGSGQTSNYPLWKRPISSEYTIPSKFEFCVADELVFSWWADEADTYRVKIYEVVAYEVIP